MRAKISIVEVFQNIEFWKGRLIEITGVPAIGKSTFLNKMKEDSSVIVFRCDKGVSWRLFIAEFIDALFLPLFDKSFSFSDLKWLFVASINVEEPFLFRLNIFRNCLLKFLHQKKISKILETDPDKVVFLDEGISHIPFLLQKQPLFSAVADDFYLRFTEVLSNLHVVCLDGNVDVAGRLKERGHKRLKESNSKELNTFINMNRDTINIIVNNSFCFNDFLLVEAT